MCVHMADDNGESVCIVVCVDDDGSNSLVCVQMDDDDDKGC